MDNRKEGSDLGVAPETVAGLSVPSPRPSGCGLSTAIPNAERNSWNHFVVIYPNDKGWAELKRLRALYYRIPQFEADAWIERGRTPDGAFKEQLWQIAAEFHSMFYNGTSYWRNTYLDFIPEP